MLTAKQNFIETVEGGHPDRFVNQYEYIEIIRDPIVMGGSTWAPEGGTRVNDWGITSIFPKGNIGAMPLDTDEYKVLKDITQWREVVKAPDPEAYSEEAWAPAWEQLKAVDRNEVFVAPFFANGIFEKLHGLMGMEDALCNFYEEPEEMHALIDFITDWEISCAKVIMKKYHPDALFHHDDWGSQTRTFLSPEMFEEFIAPAYRKIYGFWKEELGVKYIIHHSDSYAATLVPYMIDAGVDVWQGAVEENDLPALIQKYGGRMTFQAGLDNGKYDKPDWSREQLREGLDRLFKTAGTKYLIPCLTMGGPFSSFPGVYDTASELIDEFSRQYFQ